MLFCFLNHLKCIQSWAEQRSCQLSATSLLLLYFITSQYSSSSYSLLPEIKNTFQRLKYFHAIDVCILILQWSLKLQKPPQIGQDIIISFIKYKHISIQITQLEKIILKEQFPSSPLKLSLSFFYSQKVMRRQTIPLTWCPDNSNKLQNLVPNLIVWPIY